MGGCVQSSLAAASRPYLPLLKLGARFFHVGINSTYVLFYTKSRLGSDRRDSTLSEHAGQRALPQLSKFWDLGGEAVGSDVWAVVCVRDTNTVKCSRASHEE